MQNWKHVLGIYHPKYQLVDEVRGYGSSLEFRLVPFRYPYTVNEIFDYYTAPATALYLAQMAYVYCYLQAMNATEIAIAIPAASNFQREQDAAKLRIASQNIRFSRPVASTERVWASMRCNKFRWAQKNSYVNLIGNIGEGIHFTMLCCWISSEE
ncbi:MAG: hypothetical protein ACK517_03875 [bacterium]